MRAAYAMINAKGRKAIRDWLQSVRIDDGRAPVARIDDAAIDSWAEEAEWAMSQGDLPRLTLDSRYTLSDRDEEFIVPEYGVDR